MGTSDSPIQSNNLRPCPFCGKMPESYNDDGVNFYWCANEDCENFDQVCGICEIAWNTRPIEDALLARAEKAEAENATLKEERRWIPVREQMPTSGTQWVLLKNGKMDFDFTYIDGGRYDWWRNGSNVTHWMPLPEPPEVTE